MQASSDTYAGFKPRSYHNFFAGSYSAYKINHIKLKKTKMGVFRLKNTVNKKSFIEGSVNLEAVWNRHKMQLKTGRHPNSELQKDWDHYGEAGFTYGVLEEIKPSETEHVNYNMEVNALVDVYLNELQPFGDKGYNKRNR